MDNCHNRQTPGYWFEIALNCINDINNKLSQTVKPFKPGSAYWMQEDSTETYCREHAIEKRETEFGLGPLLKPHRQWPLRTELEDAFWDGIGATYDGTAESSEHCSVCGQMVSYLLTEEGLDYEAQNFAESEIRHLSPEDVYELDRVATALSHYSSRKTILNAMHSFNRARKLALASNVIDIKRGKNAHK